METASRLAMKSGAGTPAPADNSITCTSIDPVEESDMRRFEYTDDKSAKFWEIQQADTDLNIRWGRIGTAGQSQTKNFADGSKASAAMLKLVNEKLAKGY